MKNKTLLAVALVAALGFTTCSVFAEELDTKPKSHENTEVLFGDLNDNDKVVELEDGGFLYGEATITDENDPTFEPVEYNSFDDPNSITVKEAKKIILDGSASNFARGSNVPDELVGDLEGIFLKLHRVQEHIYDGQVTKMQVE